MALISFVSFLYFLWFTMSCIDTMRLDRDLGAGASKTKAFFCDIYMGIGKWDWDLYVA